MTSPYPPASPRHRGFRARFVRLSLFGFWVALSAIAPAASPLRLHPENGRYFEIDGRAAVLVGSSEHYGALIHTGFDYVRYLDSLRASGLNYLRIFTGTYREVPGDFNIGDNTLAPGLDRLLLPWPRTDVPGALDGGNKLDLDRWNPAYFHRLRELVREAGRRGIYVELTLFCQHYTEDSWMISPFNAGNHINGVGAVSRSASFQTNGDLMPYQIAFARKCIAELAGFDNVIFEVANEPYHSTSQLPRIPVAWEQAILAEIVQEIAGRPNPPLIAQNVFTKEGVISSPHPAVSIFNFHYALPAAALANLGIGRVIGHDETGGFFVEPRTDERKDFPYRREAWEFMLAGGGLMNHLDYSFTQNRPDGIAAQLAPGGGGPAIRRQLGVLRWFLDQLPLERCAPQTGMVLGGVPSGGVARVLGSPGEAYGVYLRGGTQATLALDLPAGTWRGRWIDPRSGQTTAEVEMFSHDSGAWDAASPPYVQDAALLLFGGESPPPVVQLVTPGFQTILSADGTLEILAEATVENGTIDRVEFLLDGEIVGTATGAPYHLTLADLPRGLHALRARVVASDGRDSLTPVVHCRAVGSQRAGVNLNGGELSLNGEIWLAEVDALDAGMQLDNSEPASSSPALPLYPQPDLATRMLVDGQVLRTPPASDPPLGITKPLADGDYDVFFSLVEGSQAYSRDVRVRVEGAEVATRIGEQDLGEWFLFGPYRTTVSDGSLDLEFRRQTKGAPKVAAFAAYQAEAVTPAAEATITLREAPGLLLASWPPTVPDERIEISETMEPDDWHPLDLPVAEFEDRHEVAFPLDLPRRFVRIRLGDPPVPPGDD